MLSFVACGAFWGWGIRSPSPSLSGLVFLGASGGADFWASVSPKCKEGMLQSCGWEMLLVFGCVISDTCRERVSARYWSAQCHRVSAGKFCHALDQETRPRSGSVLAAARDDARAGDQGVAGT